MAQSFPALEAELDEPNPSNKRHLVGKVTFRTVAAAEAWELCGRGQHTRGNQRCSAFNTSTLEQMAGRPQMQQAVLHSQGAARIGLSPDWLEPPLGLGEAA